MDAVDESRALAPVTRRVDRDFSSTATVSHNITPVYFIISPSHYGG
jgi:hypothetical protein